MVPDCDKTVRVLCRKSLPGFVDPQFLNQYILLYRYVIVILELSVILVRDS